MTRKHAFFCILAAIHLGLVACGALGLSLPPTESGWDKVLTLVREASGSELSHAFFAPGVGPVYRLVFVLQDARGRTWTDHFENTGAHEADLRMVELVDAMMYPDDDELRDDLARAYGQAMLNRHPTAIRVTVRVEEDEMPAMADFRTGARVQWTTAYETTVTRGKAEGQDQDANEE